jgi:hypothetical protein
VSAKLENIPVLEGWVNLTEAAEILDITRQHAYKRAKLASQGRPGGWRTLHQIGTKPSYVVSRAELQEELENRAKANTSPEE